VTQAEREAAVEDVRPIMKALADKYGEDIQLLQMPEKAAGKALLRYGAGDVGEGAGAAGAEGGGVIRLAVSELE
jgi:hypothetical protein